MKVFCGLTYQQLVRLWRISRKKELHQILWFGLEGGIFTLTEKGGVWIWFHWLKSTKDFSLSRLLYIPEKKKNSNNGMCPFSQKRCNNRTPAWWRKNCPGERSRKISWHPGDGRVGMRICRLLIKDLSTEEMTWRYCKFKFWKTRKKGDFCLFVGEENWSGGGLLQALTERLLWSCWEE